ncbi:MAG: family 43 glycosylhydrolase [Bacteroidetes bacterium]|nr:family 43 glycosylhydrolase [Bacteroidota bacterium]
MKEILLLIFILLTVDGYTCQPNDTLIPTEEIRIRDPFIVTDHATSKYYMYAQMGNRLNRSEKEKKQRGVEVYISTDLKNWTKPKPVMLLDENSWAREMVWAPEVHSYNGDYYLFVTLTASETLKNQKVPEGVENWPSFNKRGTQIFHSASLEGPFKPFDNKPHTPVDWMALDGTLWEENGIPYMIFCHEWIQIEDGSIDYVRLTDDLSGTIGKPKRLFRASEANWVADRTGKITDGCFLYRTKTDKLLMIWSSLGPKGYAIGIVESESGTLKGPWKHQKDLLFEENGGHGMIFKTFDGKLMLAFHQPNNPEGAERLKLFELNDLGNTLKLK